MTNLITIDEYKTYKEINSEAYDPTISLLIGSVSSFIKEYTDRSLIDYSLSDKIEYFDALTYATYWPKESPLLSVAEVATSVDGGVEWVILVEDTDYFVSLDSEGGDDSIIANTGLTGFLSGTITHKSGRITYKGGFIETPLDIKVAAMDLVHYFRKEDYTASKAMGGSSVQNPINIVMGNQLPLHIKRVLDLYRVL